MLNERVCRIKSCLVITDGSLNPWAPWRNKRKHTWFPRMYTAHLQTRRNCLENKLVSQRNISHSTFKCWAVRHTPGIQHPLDGTTDAGCLAQNYELEAVARDQSYVFAELLAICRHIVCAASCTERRIGISTRENRHENSLVVQTMQTWFVRPASLFLVSKRSPQHHQAKSRKVYITFASLLAYCSSQQDFILFGYVVYFLCFPYDSRVHTPYKSSAWRPYQWITTNQNAEIWNSDRWATFCSW